MYNTVTVIGVIASSYGGDGASVGISITTDSMAHTIDTTSLYTIDTTDTTI